MTPRAQKDDGVYLQDILAAIDRVTQYSGGGRDEFFTNPLVQDGVIRQFSIIGEASNKLPSSLRRNHADIPWSKIIGMRNVVVHDYSEIDLPTIWQTVEEDLPLLRTRVEAILTRRAA